ncbi:probable DNA-directed RNA polymerases I and III subunit RPAC2 [Neocloeon triangulifer]|uniref:probable DNA-directed RNA polymerases I and III subunit RPAC2 n=1 Tax=Neocloeon triangulifer TaxID=2078957 RepID=UPI00286F1470|nr:probable DNA-directed RNA polymerases I and III subunit RPAC2 [Neocloeon triangulifer]
MASTRGVAADTSSSAEPLISTLTGDEDNETDRTFVFSNEGHTLGNALRSIIAKYPDVMFCGYTVPHPAEAKMNLRIQALDTSAIDILRRALTDLSQVCDHVEKTFIEKVAEFKEANGEAMEIG